MMTKKPTLEPETPASSITKQPGQTPPWVLATNSHVGVLLASEGVVRSPRCRRERQGLHTLRQVVALLVQHSGGGQVHHLQDGKSGTGEDQPQNVNTAERKKLPTLLFVE